MTKAEDKRRHILESANHLLASRGLADISLDEVAKQAGYSKGGVTHYFANKNALLLSLADMLNQTYLDRIEGASLKEKEKVGSWSRGVIDISNHDLLSTSDVNVALVAGALASKEVSESVSDSFAFIQQRMASDGYDPVLATIVRLAIDGLYYSELFNASALDDEMRGAVLERVRSWTFQEHDEKR